MVSMAVRVASPGELCRSPSAKRSAARFNPLASFRAVSSLCFLCTVLFTALLHVHRISSGPCLWTGGFGEHGPVLVSYSYFEKDDVQMQDFEYFIKVGMGIKSSFRAPPSTDFSVVVNGEACGPCTLLYPLLREVAIPHGVRGLRVAKVGPGLTFLWRQANKGMDFAAHNATLSWFMYQQALRHYAFFIFLNSSVRGPFVPSYMPAGWAWTRAYTDRLRGDVKAVSSSIVCLPHRDAGGFGAKLESWAFALDSVGLSLLVQAGTFHVRTCKLCNEGVVVQGEYGITNVLFSRGYNVATLMSKYDRNIDWREPEHWHCNNNVHPSRHGTYDGISMHPYEVVFLKASWHVGDPFVGRYSAWELDKADGKLTTRGYFDSDMYQWAIQPEAQDAPSMAACYDVLHYDVRTGMQLPLGARTAHQQAAGLHVHSGKLEEAQGTFGRPIQLK